MKNYKLISHRGNIKGPNPNFENSENYINNALDLGYGVEIDIWYMDGNIFLGHDAPQYKTNVEFIKKENIWIHCKNIKALFFCYDNNIKNNYFFHNIDNVTLTSNNFLWTYPGKDITCRSIAVLPEVVNAWDISKAAGVCTDYVEKHSNEII
jgi:hypothetical protein